MCLTRDTQEAVVSHFSGLVRHKSAHTQNRHRPGAGFRLPYLSSQPVSRLLMTGWDCRAQELPSASGISSLHRESQTGGDERWSTEPVLAPDGRFRGSDQHSIPKNRHGCFGKRPGTSPMGSNGAVSCPAMTAFSSVPAAFLQKYRGATEPGPGEKCGSGDTPDGLPERPS